MNKNKFTGTLTNSDRELLALINSRFELAARVIGPDPAIYFEFDIEPEPGFLEISLAGKRKALLSKMSIVRKEDAGI